ncbi:hypothetical protein BDD43_5087 [Mucilaginibacter gracilis]|uniref:Uncharacterized protein n=1 Tax=Mucilaginibacter gracilis TaxID=423350 RepID=A0A495J8W4_9SPHI|nr:hypothetical protein [Mucilaginibacter gracilis]RKR84834.1 hypothetical protein BDD43_5087 [Mucilaginibacter gracilis]
MLNGTAEYQAKMYMYDLKNCAKENGFKPDDKWEVGLVTDAEKIAIENKYIPTIAVKFAPALLWEMFGLVKEKLNQSKTDAELSLNSDSIRVNELKYLIAFSAKKIRR